MKVSVELWGEVHLVRGWRVRSDLCCKQRLLLETERACLFQIGLEVCVVILRVGVAWRVVDDQELFDRRGDDTEPCSLLEWVSAHKLGPWDRGVF